MRLQRELHCSDLSGRVVFWMGGNRPTQNVFGLNARAVGSGLKACFLLADITVAAASYYFESPITRSVTRKLAPLFATGEVLYFVDEAVETFVEHGLRKMEKSPSSLTAYSSRQLVARHGREIERLGFVLRRPADSISGLLVQRWFDDVTSSDPHSIGGAIAGMAAGVADSAVLRMRLLDVARQRTTDFVWEVVEPVLTALNAPFALRGVVRQRLAAMYGETTAALIGATADAADRRLTVDVSSPTDVVLFQQVLQVLEVSEAFNRLTAPACVAVKRSPEWAFFNAFYSQLIAEVGKLEYHDLRALPILKDAERVWREASHRPSGISRSQFVETVVTLCAPLTKKAERFSKPADLLLAVCEGFSRAPISDFIQLLMETNTLATAHRRRRIAVGIITIKPIEMSAVRALFERAGAVQEVEGKLIGRRFIEGTLTGHKGRKLSAVCLRALEQGNAPAQAACNALLAEYDVRLLVLLGIGGGIYPKLELCDVVVADAVFNYERRALTEKGTAYRLDAYRMSAPIADLYGRFMEDYGEEPELDAAAGSTNSKFRAYKAPIGSGEAVVKDKLSDVRAWLELVHEKVMAVETEAVGASYVAHELELAKRNKPMGLLIVRGISDHADREKDDRWQRPASDNACAVLDKVLRAYAPTKEWHGV